MTAGPQVSTGTLLFNPNTYDPKPLDDESRRLLRATIDWFEARGKERLKADDRENLWYQDYLDFLASEGVFATFLTPAAEAIRAQRPGGAAGLRRRRGPGRPERGSSARHSRRRRSGDPGFKPRVRVS